MYTTADLAERVGGKLVGRPDLEIRGVNAIVEAAPDEITFVADQRHAEAWPGSAAAAAVVSAGVELAPTDPATRATIVVPDAEIAVVQLLELFAPAPALPEPGVHATAVIAEDARLGDGVRIGPHVSVDARATIGDGVTLAAGVRVYTDAVIGDSSIIHANCVIRERCVLGRAVILHQGVSIGGDGFGYRPDPGGAGLLKVPHVGNVVIEDGVEIGSNSCVDRAKFGQTRVGAGTKIDNLVQVGHNVRIGRCTVIAAATAIGGSVTIGDGVQVGGASSFADHVKIGPGARLGGRSGVTEDVPAGEAWLGLPAAPAYATLRQWAAIRKLPDWFRDISRRLDS
jgi:UDP-3-O-[3-hydroxymyristoyl] glucosamine N-acyltransferase